MEAWCPTMIHLYGQTVGYVPRSGSPRSISAIVDYIGPESVGPLAGGSRPHVEVTVGNDSSGILSTEIDTGGDKLKLPMRYGLTSATVRIVKIINQDEGALRLLCY